ncbi:alpha/beta hydrolase family protein [Streptomyces sp. NPDC087218]|uniref:alpha/beta hydrolase family protein n=1 Tax=Streptomyces sp. NPDC087218 TaxID=3365769 RepID=UPI0037FEB2FC
MNRRRGTTASALLGFSLALALLGTGTATAAPSAPVTTTASGVAAATELALPRPGGRHAVGTQTLHLTDHRRSDPWVPSADRELMVSVYYPAHRPAGPGGGGSAAYMTTEEARLLLEARGLDGVVPAGTVAATRTHARVDARPAPGRFPLVVLSPGFSMPRSTLTSLANDLASRGYVVAAVDHAYESIGTSFPGGRVLTCTACERVDSTEEYAGVAVGRAHDLSFVIDRLTTAPGARTRTVQGRPALPYARMVDPRRIGAAGHSIGGASAAALMARDQRVRAGLNLDGGFFAPLPEDGLGGRPFLMMGTETTHSPGGKNDWSAAWARLDGWKRWLTVSGAEHFTFTDLPVLADQLGLVDPAAPLSGERSWHLTRDYLTAFFGLHLRGAPQPLLDGPSADHPEVAFRQP